jgi:16S rRNA (guanine1207-N2)-methyltransferase
VPRRRPDHYFSSQPEVRSAPRTVAVMLRDLDLRLETDRGVFALARLDPGTRELLETAPDPPSRGDLLDLGAGYGPIAIALARRSPQARVWAVDVNERALELVRRNAARATATNVVAARPDEVPPEVRFAGIYSNPPIRVGKEALHEMLGRWLDRLQPEGRAFLVVHKHLGSDSLARWLNERGHATRRLASRKGYRILEARPKTPAQTATGSPTGLSGPEEPRRE